MCLSFSLLSLKEVLVPVRRDPMPWELLYSLCLHKLLLSPSACLSSLPSSSSFPLLSSHFPFPLSLVCLRQARREEGGEKVYSESDWNETNLIPCTR